MSINRINGASERYSSQKAIPNAGSARTEEKAGQKMTDTAAVYESGSTPDSKAKVYRRDNETVERMVAEAEKRSQSLRDLVERMLLKQGQAFDASTDIYALLREGKVQVDPETRVQAQKDIAEDGYWGVEQTSERMLSFAKALSGGDPSKAGIMIDAVKKGFEQAMKAWGGELPQICRDTLDRTIKKLEDWRDTLKDEEAARAAEVS